jgi:hypothetical protein
MVEMHVTILSVIVFNILLLNTIIESFNIINIIIESFNIININDIGYIYIFFFILLIQMI